MADADVLVVDDDAEINDLVGSYVQIAGFNYRAALDAATALKSARKSIPALIILDLMLPDMDGFAVCKELRRDKMLASIPIVMLTAMNREDTRKQAEECGAADYLTKPFDPEKLLATIRRHAQKPEGAKLPGSN